MAHNIDVQCNKCCVFTACSFPHSNSEQEERMEGEEKRGKGTEWEREREKGAIGKEREGWRGMFLSWREMAL